MQYALGRKCTVAESCPRRRDRPVDGLQGDWYDNAPAETFFAIEPHDADTSLDLGTLFGTSFASSAMARNAKSPGSGAFRDAPERTRTSDLRFRSRSRLAEKRLLEPD
jgi:hypothetical protein